MTTQRQHPSVLFQSGEVKDFHTAMQVYVDQQREELRRSHELNRLYHNFTFAELEEAAQSVALAEVEANIARGIYQEYVKPAIKQAAQKMREHGSPALKMIADALESGNYDGLAL